MNMSNPFSGFGNSLIGGGLSFLGGERANKANAAMAGRQMEFQMHMSNSAHQRQVQDLKDAGLNPILSANAGASSPAGATAQMQNSLQPAVGSALEAKRVANETKSIKANTALADQNARTSATQAIVNGATAKNALETNRLLREQLKQSRLETKAKKSETNYRVKDADDRTNNFMLDKTNQRINNVLGTVNNAKGLFNPLGGLIDKFFKGRSNKGILKGADQFAPNSY